MTCSHTEAVLRDALIDGRDDDARNLITQLGRADVERELELEKTLLRFEGVLDVGRCLHCRTQIEEAFQVGRCVYARPCGHRQGQGNAKAFNRRNAGGEAARVFDKRAPRDPKAHVQLEFGGLL